MSGSLLTHWRYLCLATRPDAHLNIRELSARLSQLLKALAAESVGLNSISESHMGKERVSSHELTYDLMCNIVCVYHPLKQSKIVI